MRVKVPTLLTGFDAIAESAGDFIFLFNYTLRVNGKVVEADKPFVVTTKGRASIEFENSHAVDRGDSYTLKVTSTEKYIVYADVRLRFFMKGLVPVLRAG